MEKNIKIISLLDHEYIFVQIQNSIQIYESSKFNLVEKIYLETNIKCFEVNEQNFNLVILSVTKTSTFLHIYHIDSNIYKDYYIHFNYFLKEKREIEKIENLSISPIGDVFVTIDKAKILKFFSLQTFEIIKKSKIASEFVFPIDLFNFTRDTKNILVCNYTDNFFSAIYKLRKQDEDGNDLGSKLITFPQKIINMKEYVKHLKHYARYENNSIFFILTDNMSFLVLRKIFNEEIPDFIVVYYIDLKPLNADISTSFELLCFNSSKNNIITNFNVKIEESFSDLQTYFINSDNYERYLYHPDDNNIDSFNLRNYKNVVVDYIIFSIGTNIIIFKAEGLRSHPDCSVNIELITKLVDKYNTNNSYKILFFTRGLEKKLFIYFLDKSNLISKCYINPENVKSGLFECDRFIKIYNKIEGLKFNNQNNKVLFLEYNENYKGAFESYVYITNMNLYVKKVFYFPMKIDNVDWIENSNFFYFTIEDKLVIININSEYFLKIINFFNIQDINKLIYININEITQFTNLRTLKFMNFKISKKNEKITVDWGMITDKYFAICELNIETNTSISDVEFIFSNSLKKFEKLSANTLSKDIKNFFVYHNPNNKVLHANYYTLEKNILRIFDSLVNNDKPILSLVIENEDIIFHKYYEKESREFILILTTSNILLIDLYSYICSRTKHYLLIKKEDNFKIDLNFCFNTIFAVLFINSKLTFLKFDNHSLLSNHLEISFLNKFELNSDHNLLINLKHNLLCFNHQQVEKMTKFINLQSNFRIEIFSKSVPKSIFDLETCFDYLLANEINCLKLILSLAPTSENETNTSDYCLKSLKNRKLEKLILDNSIKIPEDKADIPSERLVRYPDLSLVHEQIFTEVFSSCDNVTKYFNIKFHKLRSKNVHFKFTTSDLCWISLINDQEYLIKLIFKNQSMITWSFFKQFCVPIWLKNEIRLKNLVEIIGKNELKILMSKNELIGDNANIYEQVSLYYFLSGKTDLLLELLQKESKLKSVVNFLSKNFDDQKNKRAARNNSTELKKQNRFVFAIMFSLLGGDMTEAIDICINKLYDINLAFTILKLYPDPKNESLLNSILQDFFIDLGLALRDPWLTLSGYIYSKKIDTGLEYILKYNSDYEVKKEVLSNPEFLNENLSVVKSVLDISQFDYRLIIFAKNLEKMYRKLMEEQKKNTRSVASTAFDDEWGDDFDEPKAPVKVAEVPGTFLKELNVNYENLCYLTLIDSLIRGSAFNPIFSYSKPFSYFNSSGSLRTLLSNTLANLIVSECLSWKMINVNSEENKQLFDSINDFIKVFEGEMNIQKEIVFKQTNYNLLQLNEFQLCSVTLYNSNRLKLSETYEFLYNEVESILKQNLIKLLEITILTENQLIDFKRNIEIIEKTATFLLFVMRNQFPERKESHDSNHHEAIDSKTKYLKVEHTLYLLRIILVMIMYQIIMFKNFFSYEKIRISVDQITKIIISFFKENTQERFTGSLELILKNCQYCRKKIQNKRESPKEAIEEEENDVYTNYYKKILHYSVIKKLNEIFSTHFILNSSIGLSLKKFKIQERSKNLLYTHHEFINENFNIIKYIISMNNLYIEKFKDILENYLITNTSISGMFDIHEEMKVIYLRSLNQDSNFYKFGFIKIKKLFKSGEKLKDFENFFNLKDNISFGLSKIVKSIRYERDEVMRVCKQSVKVINSVFKKGLDLVLFKDDFKINDFCVNNCDSSKVSIALLNNGHRKVNTLFNVMFKKRSEDFMNLNEFESNQLDEIYRDCLETNFSENIDAQLPYKYNEVLSIAQEEFSKHKNNHFFEPYDKLPPDIFNENASSLYLQESPHQPVTNSTFSNIVVSHPVLPLYLSAGNKGIVHTWSFNDSKTSLDDYFLEKIGKDNQNKIKKLKKMKFNHYGNEFFVLDESGNLLFFKFDTNKTSKNPFITLWSSNLKSSKDARYLNNGGLLASTSNINNKHTTVWDFLLPLSQSNVMDFENGGNIVTSYSSSPTILIGNELPGYISFLDFRRNSIVTSFQAHLDEIKSILISERENFMVTLGKDSIIKIWDIAYNKIEPQLVESFYPFSESNGKKQHIHVQIVNGLLFGSNENSLRLFRTKLH